VFTMWPLCVRSCLSLTRCRPTRPSLFPYTTLFRSRYVHELPWYVFIGAPGSGKTTALVNSGLKFPLREKSGGAGADARERRVGRSEEHTSELQSRSDLVCRLLRAYKKSYSPLWSCR